MWITIIFVTIKKDPKINMWNHEIAMPVFLQCPRKKVHKKSFVLYTSLTHNDTFFVTDETMNETDKSRLNFFFLQRIFFVC